MTYSRYDSGESNNSRQHIGWIMGTLPGSTHDYRKDARRRVQAQILRFDRIWTDLKDNLQEPIHDEGGNFGGYTGHRIVTFEDQLGRCALGFYLQTVATDLYRTISATRRMIYQDDEPRHELIVDEQYVRLNDVRYHDIDEDDEYDRRLSAMRTWANKFLSAQSYEDLREIR